jgi:CMP-N,N'-diacetyllegionaminic acid synthase
MEILAIIPARGGSKGLKNKNILPIFGHPLIAYSIRAAQLAKQITRVIVSTDSQDIANVAIDYGAEVPFMRPAEISQDLSTDIEMFQHALGWLKDNEGYVPDYVVQLRPTSPIRFAEEIDFCIEKMAASEADSLRIVTESPCTPYKMWRVDSDSGMMQPLLTIDGVPESYNMPRQQLPKVYWQVGTLDVIKTTCITEKGSLSGTKVLSHIISNEAAIDIDDINSFEKVGATINKLGSVRFSL